MENEQFEDDFVVSSGSPDFRSELASQLAELAPEVIADGKVDVVKLQELLGEDVADSAERFGLFWPGKKNALRVAQAPTTATLRPDIENSKDWDTTQNVFIEGDNLEVLKILQKHYHNKIKMIYIDPPYNTGKDFVYPDNFKEGLDSYLEWTRQVNEEGKKLSTNSETEGRYHSNWLNMMYPRLKLARNLLTDDGVIFISIDDNEQDNLKKICNEIFGEANFLAVLPTIMNLKGNNDQFGFAGTHEYTIVYAKSLQNLSFGKFLIDDEGLEQWLEDEIGPFKRGANLKATGGNAPRHKRPNLFFPLYINSDQSCSVDFQTGWEELFPMTDGQEMSWRWSKEKFRAQSHDVIVTGGPGNYTIYKKQRPELGDMPSAKPKSIFYKADYSSGNGTATVKKLFKGNKFFDNPKPISLLRDFLEIGNTKESVILDFFAGSSSTAHAVMALNAEDGGNRKFVMVQLPEPTPEDSEARKAGFETIADISRERIRRAGASIVAERDGQLDAGEKPLDVGFRSYKLNASNFAKWNVTSDIEPGKLGEHLMTLRGSADDDATPDDLLTEVLLKQGYSLTEHISKVSIDGLELHSVGDGLVLAYLDENVKPTLEQFRAVVDAAPARLIVLEDAYQGDDQLKTNLEQLCRSKSIELWRA